MRIIDHTEFGGERPLYAERDLRLEHVVIHPGESALKETARIEASDCIFEGKYPFWCTDGFTVDNCIFREGARAALWYSKDCRMNDTLIEAPKMFREMDGVTLRRVRLTNAQETFWFCRDLDLEDVETEKADYIYLRCSNIRIRNYRQNGNYSFQYARNVEIRDAVLNTKDAFWNSENVTVYDSQINGEYLGWYSKGLRLVTSVKNPRSGRIIAGEYGEIIFDRNIKAPADCEIRTWDNPDHDLSKDPEIVEY